MATGYQWSAYAFLTYSTGTDIDAIDVNDEATLTSDEVDLDGKAACEIAVEWVEGNDGACDGDVYVHVCREDGDGDYQTIDDDPSLGAVIDAEQNTTRYKMFAVDPGEMGTFKILVDNDSGQDGDLSIWIRTATFDDGT